MGALMSAMMDSLLSLAAALADVLVLPPWMNAAWLVFAAWMGVQLIWFRRARVVPLPPPVPRRTTPAKPKPVVPKERVPVVSVGGTPEFLAELGLHDGHPARGAESVYR